MTAAQIRELSGAFEIGAHTLRHVDLTHATDEQARQEITASRSWIEEVTGSPCLVFCPPQGRFARRHLGMIRQAGYDGMRSVELLSLDFPRRDGDLSLMPTTLQAHPHGWLVYARNALKRGTLGNLRRAIVHCCSGDWTRPARSLLRLALDRGGVFHLWGHSWEMEQTGQWQRLEEVLRFLSQHVGGARTLTNGQLCQVTPAVPVEVSR
jgi:peptidoglycan/xylan/chitin deacetylase (PgdA/CDA1 family)